VTSSWFFLSTLNYDAQSNTHLIYRCLPYVTLLFDGYSSMYVNAGNFLVRWRPVSFSGRTVHRGDRS